jgi:hypothetical protein
MTEAILMTSKKSKLANLANDKSRGWLALSVVLAAFCEDDNLIAKATKPGLSRTGRDCRVGAGHLLAMTSTLKT